MGKQEPGEVQQREVHSSALGKAQPLHQYMMKMNR